MGLSDRMEFKAEQRVRVVSAHDTPRFGNALKQDTTKPEPTLPTHLSCTLLSMFTTVFFHSGYLSRCQNESERCSLLYLRVCELFCVRVYVHCMGLCDFSSTSVCMHSIRKRGDPREWMGGSRGIPLLMKKCTYTNTHTHTPHSEWDQAERW